MNTPDLERLKLLEALASIAVDALRGIDNWLGQASTREAAMDAIWRLRRALKPRASPIRFTTISIGEALCSVRWIAPVSVVAKTMKSASDWLATERGCWRPGLV
jgi:hypothetical protein